MPFAQLDHDERCSSFDSVVCLGSDRKFLPEKDLEKNTYIRGEIGRRRDDGKGKFKRGRPKFVVTFLRRSRKIT